MTVCTKDLNRDLGNLILGSPCPDCGHHPYAHIDGCVICDLVSMRAQQPVPWPSILTVTLVGIIAGIALGIWLFGP